MYWWGVSCRRPLAGILGAVMVLPLLPAAPPLSVVDRSLLAEYRVMEEAQIPMLLATAPDGTAGVASRIRQAGGRIVAEGDRVGYLYAYIPLDAVLPLGACGDLEAWQVAAQPSRGELGVESAASPALPAAAAPSLYLRADNPFTAESAVGARQFKMEHPTYDGRGVTIGFVEPVTPTLTSLRDALDLSGRVIPKFAAYEWEAPGRVGEAVLNNDAHLVWQQTDQVTPDSQGNFSWQELSYHLPAGVSSQEWRICTRLRREGADPRDFIFLWAVDLDKVWVLEAKDGRDFSSGVPVALAPPVGIAPVLRFSGTGPSRGALRSLLVKADLPKRLLGIYPAFGHHAGMVATVMAGSRFFGSEVDGMAPASRLAVFVDTLLDPSLWPTFATIRAFRSPDVDLVESSMVAGGTTRFDRPSVFDVWLARLVRGTGKPYVRGIGNYGPRMFGLTDFTEAADGFTIGAYTPPETWRASFGITPAAEHTLPSYSGYGPARDGGLKPEFLALTATLSEGSPPAAAWKALPGLEDFGVSGGTSAAGPHAAGSIALLLSAARQKGIPADPIRLRAALATSARFLEGVEARMQGHGLLQIPEAWAALQRAAHWESSEFQTAAPLVMGEDTPSGPLRGIGRGILELSGWEPNTAGERRITLTRISGPEKAGPYQLRWKGDTTAFRCAAEVGQFPLGRPVNLPIKIQVAEGGAYSAILDLIDESSGLVVHSVLCTVVAAPVLATSARVICSGSVPRPGNRVLFVRVPAGLRGMSVRVENDGAGIGWSAQDPTGRMIPLVPYGSDLGTRAPKPVTDRFAEYHYPHPVPGTWQFWLNNPEPRNAAEVAAKDWSHPTPFRADFVAEDNNISPQIVAPTSASDQTVISLQRHGDASLHRIDVPEGIARLNITAGGLTGHVALYLYKIPKIGRHAPEANTIFRTAMIYYDPSHLLEKTYELTDPPPGEYWVALDPLELPAEKVAVTLRIEMAPALAMEKH